jgi:hypothetical protein
MKENGSNGFDDFDRFLLEAFVFFSSASQQE